MKKRLLMYGLFLLILNSCDHNQHLDGLYSLLLSIFLFILVSVIMTVSSDSSAAKKAKQQPKNNQSHLEFVMYFKYDKIRSQYYQKVTRTDTRFCDEDYCVAHMHEFDVKVDAIILDQKFAAKFSKNNLRSKYYERVVAKAGVFSSKDYCIKHIHEFDSEVDAVIYDDWIAKQQEFNNACAQNWEIFFKGHVRFSYDITIDQKPRNVINSFRVVQYSRLQFCKELDLDYTQYPSLVKANETVSKLKTCKFPLFNSAVDPILGYADWVRETYGSVFVLFDDRSSDILNIEPTLSDEGIGMHYESLNDFHFKYLIDQLEEREIPYCYVSNEDLNYLCFYKYVMIIDLITENEHLKNTCKDVIERIGFKNEPVISYVSLMKELSRDEMQRLIKIKNEDIAQQKLEDIKALSETFKSDALQITNLLKKNGIRYFCHFTDRKNLASIKKHGGLYSWSYLEKHSIIIPNPGGNGDSRNLDRNYGLEDFVRLSFCESHPMAYRKIKNGDDIITLKIAIDVATLESTLFSDMNATDNKHKCGSTIEDLLRVNFVATQKKFIKRDDPDFKPLQAECMVKTCVPVKFILNLNDF